MNGQMRPRFVEHTLLIACVMLGMLGAYADEKVKKAGGRLSYNQSTLLPPYHWAHLSYNLINAADKAAGVKLRISPMGQRNVTVYEVGTTIGPNMRLRYRELVTVGSVREHGVDLLQDGENLTKIGNRAQANHLARFMDKFIIFLNDDVDVGRGQFNNIAGFGGHFVNAASSAKYMPQHWAGYDSAHAIIVFRPDYARLNNRQYRALLTYIGRGGTVIFADPEGAIQAWKSPLRKCMPAIPLRIRPVEQIPEFTELGGTPAKFVEPINLLEMQPLHGMSTVKHDGFPLIHWGKYGLGYVGMTAIRPNDRELSHENFILFYRHLFRYGGCCPYVTSSTNPELTQAADKLSGVEIPSAHIVHGAIAGYVLIVIVLVVLGVLRKRLALAWGLVAGTAIIATAAVFAYAGYLRRDLPEKSASILEFRNYGCAELCREQVASVMLKREKTIDLPNDNPDLRLRATPPPADLDGLKLLMRRQMRPSKGRPAKATPAKTTTAKNNRGSKKKKQKTPEKTSTNNRSAHRFGEQQHGEKDTFQDPLWVTVDGGLYALRGLTLRDSKPQFINTLANAQAKGYMTLPKLSWTAGRPTISTWKVPDDIPCDQAILLCEEGYFPLSIDDRQLSCSALKPPTDRSTDPGIAAVRHFLVSSAMPTPVIVVFSTYKDGTDANGYLPSDFRVNGRIVTFVPVTQELSTTDVTISSKRIEVGGSPANRRILRAHGTWIAEGLTNEREPLLITAKLPLGYEHVQPKQLTIDLDAINMGGNIKFKLSLYPMGKKDDAIPLEPSEDGRYHVDATKIKTTIIHPADGSIILALEVQEKERITDQVARARLNRWRIKDVRVAITGTLPKQYHGRL